MNPERNEMEVIALDADDHLLRPMLIQLNLSELRLFPVRVDCILTSCLISHPAA